MTEYILTEVKQLVGIYEDTTAFDVNLILYINSTFSRLHQLGAGPSEGFWLTNDGMKTWGQYTDNSDLLGLVKDYVVTKTLLKFNPPANSTLIQELHDHISELEYSILNITDTISKAGEPTE